MLAIRFVRVGKKNQPQFKIMLQEHTIAPGGAHVEVLGSYDPRLKKAVLKDERIKYWISQGVKVSDTAYNLFLKQGLLTGEKRKVKIPARKAEPSEADGPAKKAEEVVTEAVTPDAAKPEETKMEAVEVPKAKAVAQVDEAKKEEKPKKEAPKSEENKEDAPVVAEEPRAEKVSKEELEPAKEMPVAEETKAEEKKEDIKSEEKKAK